MSIAYSFYTILIELYPNLITMHQRMLQAQKDKIITLSEEHQLRIIWYGNNKPDYTKEIV